jgi:hypothetical protein
MELFPNANWPAFWGFVIAWTIITIPCAVAMFVDWLRRR